MALKLATIIFLLSCTICHGQIDTTMVPFVSYWSKGDSYDFKITKIKQKWKDGEMTKNDSSSYVVNFEVIDSTETNYKIKWSYKTNLSDFNVPPQLKDKFSKYDITEVIYETSELGEFIGIENWEEIALMTKVIFTDLIDALSEDEIVKKEELNTIMQPLLKVYESKEGIEQLIFKELYYFYFPFSIWS